MIIKERNLAVAIILTIVTCGIYGLYWFVKLTDETKYLTGTDGADGITALLLTLVTCGIYGLYWNYKLGEKVDMLKRNRGQDSTSSSVLFIIHEIVDTGEKDEDGKTITKREPVPFDMKKCTLVLWALI